MEIDSEYEDLEIKIEPGTIFTRLTPLVRKVYFNHLRTTLQNNVQVALPKLKGSRKLRKYVQKVAEQMENKAIEASVVTQLYQQEMQAFIKSINRSTSKCRAEKTFLNMYNESEMNKISCTNDIWLKSEADEISASYSGFPKDIVQRCVSSCSMPNSSPEIDSKCVNVTQSSFLESGFMDDSPAQWWNTPRSANFGVRLVQPTVPPTTPLNELPPPSALDHDSGNAVTFSPTSHDTPPNTSNFSATEESPCDKHEPFDEVSYDSVERHLAEMFEGVDNATENIGDVQSPVPVCNGVANLKRNQLTDLSQSVWPCRLYMDKQRLNDVLYNHHENDFRRTEEIKHKFYVLFGEDSDDEFNLQSPRIDHNLKRSFLNNIFKALWRYLLKANDEGLIANRYLLKRLGKQLTQAIYAEKHYPTDGDIKTAVYNFFCVNHKVKSIADTNNIPAILTRPL